MAAASAGGRGAGQQPSSSSSSSSSSSAAQNELVVRPSAPQGITQALVQMIQESRHNVSIVRCSAEDQLYGAVDWALNRQVGVLYLGGEQLVLAPAQLVPLLKGLQPFPHRFVLLRQDLSLVDNIAGAQLLVAQYGYKSLPVADEDQAARFMMRMFSAPRHAPLAPGPDLDECMVEAVQQIPGFGRVSARELLRTAGSLQGLAELAARPGPSIPGMSAAKARAVKEFMGRE